MFYDPDIGTLVRMTRRHFAEINRDKTLTDGDKKRLKDFYLEHFVSPRARKLLQKHFLEDFASEFAARPAAPGKHVASVRTT